MTSFTRPHRVVRQHRSLIPPALWLSLMLVVVLGAHWLAPYDPTSLDLRARLQPPAGLGGSWRHPLGTDNLGRDILSRLIYATQLSLLCALLGSVIGGVLGTALGFLAARWRVADALVSAAIDFQAALPFLIFAIALLAIFGNSLFLFIGILSIYGWERYARLTRTLARSALQDGYAFAALARGVSWGHLAMRHILPNIFGALIVNLTLNIPQTILLEAAISFLGIGVQPPLTSLGTMLGFSRDYLSSAWWLAVFPGLIIILTTLSINALGNRLADWLDPKR